MHHLACFLPVGRIAGRRASFLDPHPFPRLAAEQNPVSSDAFISLRPLTRLFLKCRLNHPVIGRPGCLQSWHYLHSASSKPCRSVLRNLPIYPRDKWVASENGCFFGPMHDPSAQRLLENQMEPGRHGQNRDENKGFRQVGDRP